VAAQEFVEAQLARAHDCLAVIPSLIEKGYNGFAIERAYYACFHAASALLATRGLGFSKHSAVISTFGKEFAGPRLIDPVHHETLSDLFEARLDVTYRFEAAPSQEEARESERRATEFVAAVGEFLLGRQR
jgi:uncharacterized protein (UPF0332 family)